MNDSSGGQEQQNNRNRKGHRDGTNLANERNRRAGQQNTPPGARPQGINRPDRDERNIARANRPMEEVLRDPRNAQVVNNILLGLQQPQQLLQPVQQNTQPQGLPGQISQQQNIQGAQYWPDPNPPPLQQPVQSDQWPQQTYQQNNPPPPLDISGGIPPPPKDSPPPPPPPLPPQPQTPTQQQPAAIYQPPSPRRKWLQSSDNWDDLSKEDGWLGVKFLGKGGYGRVGLWQKFDKSGKLEASVAVKEHEIELPNLQDEATFLEMVKGPRVEHIICILKGYHEAVVDGNTVARIYLEFCETGDLRKFFDRWRSNNPNKPFPEEWLWRLFKCLARAILALDEGQEELNMPRVFPEGQAPIAHLDIKFENVLVGGNDTTRHPVIPIMKVADFGLAMQKALEDQTAKDAEDLIVRGTYNWRAPEQLRDITPKFGSWTNIWAIGKIIYVIMTRGLDENNFYARKKRTLEDVVTETYGANYEVYCGNGPYSATLRDLVFQCLAMDPNQRPTPRALLRAILEASNIYVKKDGEKPEDVNPELGGQVAAATGTYPQIPVNERVQIADNDGVDIAMFNTAEPPKEPGEQGQVRISGRMVDPLDIAEA